MMGAQLMEQARRAGVEKFVAIGTICAYPKFTPVPFREDDLWDGYPEETNAPYGLAKKMLLVQAQAYRQQYGFNAIYLLPVNLYGPGDNFDPDSSHVIPALIRKCVEAQERGRVAHRRCGARARRRASSCTSRDAPRASSPRSSATTSAEPVNLGSGEEISHPRPGAADRARDRLQRARSGSTRSQPDGQPRRKLDTSARRGALRLAGAHRLPDRARATTVEWYRGAQSAPRAGDAVYSAHAYTSMTCTRATRLPAPYRHDRAPVT